jgi:hypothetical protein
VQELKFIRTDITMRSPWARDTALIGKGAGGIVAGVNRGGTRDQRDGLGPASVEP